MQGEELTTFLIILAVVLIVFAIIWFAMRRRKTAALRDRFGEEYDRTVGDVGGRSDAERNLEAREKRVSDLRIRPLTIEERDRFAGEWKDVKALFVDSPQEAVLRGDRLLGQMMETRGFPMADFDRRYEDLTVNHGEVARHYREGHDIAGKRDQATTEEMRRALNHYERLYDELVRDAGTGLDTAATTSRTAHRDRDGDGVSDTRDIDRDGDGVVETRGVDIDGDGDADHVTTTQTQLGRPVRPD